MCKFYRIASNGLQAIQVVHELFDCASYTNPNLDLININVYPKFGQISSICSEDIERKRNSDKNHRSSRAITLLLFDGN